MLLNKGGGVEEQFTENKEDTCEESDEDHEEIFSAKYMRNSRKDVFDSVRSS